MYRNLLLSAMFVAGCGPTPDADAGALDAGARSDAEAAPCARDLDCDDGRFCNGAEVCTPGADGADARGCVSAAEPPCIEGQRCDENARRCETECAVAMDADGDGHAAIECGGDDCDDSDGGRFPGNPEVCDATDQDCDDRTIAGADGDQDGDGFVSTACCAPDPFGLAPPRCGQDCDDQAAGINPGSPEACNGVDDNCSGVVDEGLLSVFYPDGDLDLYGREDEAIEACARPPGHAVVGGDCDDDERTVNPGRVELCNGLDDDCDGTVDEEAFDLGTDDHCGACFDTCQFDCNAGSCTRVVAIAAGGVSTLVSLEDGRLFGWGSNGDGRLAQLGPRNAASPLGSIAPGAFQSLAVGAEHACGVHSNSVYCWGANWTGQVGIDTISESELPTRTMEGRTVRVGAGSNHGCSVGNFETSASAIHCWGRNNRSQVGVFGHPHLSPVLVALPEGAAEASRVAGGDEHTCATDTAGAVYCWGWNEFGATGQPLNLSVITTPRLVSGVTGIVWIGAGSDYSCGLDSAGGAWCWGLAENGRLGDGEMMHPEVDGPGSSRASVQPVAVALPGPADEISVGDRHACARIGADVFCWGAGSNNQNGQVADAWLPQQVLGLTGTVEHLAAGGFHTCALTTEGSRVLCWGANNSGQLGRGDTSTGGHPPAFVVRP